MPDALLVRTRLEKHLLELEGVVGVSHCNPCEKIILYVEDETWAEAVPSVLAGLPVEIKIVGKVTILPLLTQQIIPNRLKHRPILGGISISPPERIAGTLGIITKDGKILTNAHVLAIDYQGRKYYEKGTPIIQPGILDDGNPKTDVVGYLDYYIPIKDEENTVDVAIGIPIVETRQMEVLGLGEVDGWTDPIIGMKVTKAGRTTGITRGQIIDIHATLKVYGYTTTKKGYAIFEDLIVIEPAMSSGGDSGSLLVNEKGRAVGLIFAGSKFITVACKIRNVIDSTGVDLGEYQKPEIPPPTPPRKTRYEPVSILMSVLPFGLLVWGMKGEGDIE